MTDMEGLGQSNDVVQPVSAPQSTSVAGEAHEKLFKQSEVNDIVKRAKHETLESYKRMAQEQPEYFKNKYSVSSQEHNQNIQPHNTISSEERTRQVAAEEVERLRNQWNEDAQRKAIDDESKKIANEFFSKITTGKEKYQDFDQVMGAINLPQYTNSVQLANMFPNTADVWYSLVNDPVKLEAIETMAVRSPQAAYAQLQKLSKSLTDNEAAANVKMPNAPLSQLRPSNTGTDNGAMSVSDYRKKYKV